MLDETGDKNWVFDTHAKKPLITRLFTTMSGSVVTKAGNEKKTSRGGRGKADKDKDKENTQPNKRRAKAKAKAQASAEKSNALPGFNLPAETSLGETTVACDIGVRPKLWIDDLLACVAHVVTSVKSMGFQHAVDFVKLKSDLIDIGLNFAFQGQVVLHDGQQTKQYSRWSRLRPALKQYALHKILQD